MCSGGVVHSGGAYAEIHVKCGHIACSLMIPGNLIMRSFKINKLTSQCINIQPSKARLFSRLRAICPHYAYLGIGPKTLGFALRTPRFVRKPLAVLLIFAITCRRPSGFLRLSSTARKPISALKMLGVGGDLQEGLGGVPLGEHKGGTLTCCRRAAFPGYAPSSGGPKPRYSKPGRYSLPNTRG